MEVLIDENLRIKMIEFLQDWSNETMYLAQKNQPIVVLRKVYGHTPNISVSGTSNQTEKMASKNYIKNTLDWARFIIYHFRPKNTGRK